MATYKITATTPAITNLYLQASGDSTYGSPQIQSIRMSKESQLETIPYPSKDSDYVISYDILGVIRHIDIQGNNQATVTQLKKFILDIEAIINGQQYNRTTPKHTVVLTLGMGGAASDVDITYNVVLKSFSWTFNAGNPYQIDWTLECIQATTSF